MEIHNTDCTQLIFIFFTLAPEYKWQQQKKKSPDEEKCMFPKFEKNVLNKTGPRMDI